VSSVGSQAVTGWQGSQQAFAEACVHAGLTRVQTEAAGLWSRGASYREIALALALPYPEARDATRRAARKLQGFYGYLRRTDRAWLREVFAAIRNVTPNSSRLHVYAPLPGGGHDDQPLGMPAAPDGSRAEDLASDGRRFLRRLPFLLTEHARRAADELAQSAVALTG
jgi:hypothetical protein